MAVVTLTSATAIGIVRTDPIGFVYVTVTAFVGAFLVSLQAARGRKAPPPPS